MISHHFGGGVYAKETRVPAGYVLVQHAHKFAHLSILAEGSVEVAVDGQVSTLFAPACIEIEAGKHHGIKALTEVVWYCVHATDCTDADEVDETLVVPANEAAQQAIVKALVEEH